LLPAISNCGAAHLSGENRGFHKRLSRRPTDDSAGRNCRIQVESRAGVVHGLVQRWEAVGAAFVSPGKWAQCAAVVAGAATDSRTTTGEPLRESVGGEIIEQAGGNATPQKEAETMTIDERLEALTMHLEVVTHLHEDLEKRHDEFKKQMTEYAADVKDAIHRLANIAASHEERIERLEDRQQ
jgi:hypothetical protein